MTARLLGGEITGASKFVRSFPWRHGEVVEVERRRVRWEVEAVMLACELPGLPADTEVS